MNISNDTTTDRTLTDRAIADRARTASDSVHRGIDRASEVAHATAESAAASASRLAAQAERTADKLSQQQEKVRAKTISFANEHPMRAIVLSLGVGFVLAKLLGRRS